MDVPPPDPNSDWLVHLLLWACNGLVVTVLAVGGFVMNLYRQKVDDLEKVNNNYVSREELDERFQVLRDDRQRMHQENLDNLGSIRQTIENGQAENRVDIRDLNHRFDDNLRALQGKSRRIL